MVYSKMENIMYTALMQLIIDRLVDNITITKNSSRKKAFIEYLKN